MADLDNLLGSRISLITIQDIRYDGVLFSINAAESSIVVRDVRTLGTEDRVTDPTKMIAATTNVLSFVSFPGGEIKDLYVHEAKNEDTAAVAPAAPAPTSPQRPPKAPQTNNNAQSQPPRPPSQGQGRNNQEGGQGQAGRGGRGSYAQAGQAQPGQGQAQGGRGQGRGGQQRQGGDAQPPRERQQQQQPPRENQAPREPRQPRPPRADAGPATAVGTGAHLLKLRVKKGDGANAEEGETAGEFDFEAGLGNFNKEEVLQKVADEGTVTVAPAATTYKKDDFFDCLSNDAARGDKVEIRRTQTEERALNQDTFGAIALQSNNYRRGGRGGYRGGGRGGGGGRDGGGGREGGGYSGGGGYRGRGRGRGGGRGQGQAAAN